MNGLRDAIANGDPIAREGGLSATDADRIRRVVVAASDTERETGFWPRPIFVAATLAVTMLVGSVIGTRFPRSGTRSAPPAAAINASQPAMQLAERRQLQFATPGGTRIIWVFDPAFNP